jgi:hypothetical protein
MPANYVLINEITTNAPVSSVVFSSIPQTSYTDLKIVVSARTDQSGVIRSFKVQPNAVDVTARRLGAEGSPFTAYSDSTITLYCPGTGSTSNTYGNAEIYISNYNSTTAYKTLSSDIASENNAESAGLAMNACLYSANTAITSLTVLPSLGNFIAGCTFSLYGIAAFGVTPTVVPKASGGDIINNDGTYWYHTFLASGTFIPNQNLTTDYLVVAGGGAGSGWSGGGGGAGGMRCTVTGTGGSGSLESPLSLTATSYTVTIGAGGAGANNSNALRGFNGSNSVFASITSTGGGGGGNRIGGSPIGNGAPGGSGGGGSVDGYTGGAASPSGQGFAGGASPGATNPGGGGGGAAAVGQDGGTANLNGGDGGAGRATVISGTSTYYAGGGGGSYGAAGTGEGGIGGGASAPTSNNTAGNAATVNTGGGGSAGNGGAGTGPTGGSGGSGIVIVRYTMA